MDTGTADVVFCPRANSGRATADYLFFVSKENRSAGTNPMFI